MILLIAIKFWCAINTLLSTISFKDRYTSSQRRKDNFCRGFFFKFLTLHVRFDNLNRLSYSEGSGYVHGFKAESLNEFLKTLVRSSSSELVGIRHVSNSRLRCFPFSIKRFESSQGIPPSGSESALLVGHQSLYLEPHQTKKNDLMTFALFQIFEILWKGLLVQEL